MPTTYKITIKDNSIPEHMRLEGHPRKEYTAIIEQPFNITGHFNMSFSNNLIEYIQDLAQSLDTDPESLEILSIIKQ